MSKSKAKTPPRRRIQKLMIKRGWNRRHGGDIRHRLCSMFMHPHQWWDWGHHLMALVGQDDGGNWSEPEPPTWWYRHTAPHRMFRTGYPRYTRRNFEIIKNYKQFIALTEGLEKYEWQAINVSQDGELQLGHRYWGGTFYGMRKDETWILRKYLRHWHRIDWWGARSWLFSQALHAAVNRKRPFRCHVAPPRGAGGYDHWFCDEKRRHDGPHRYGAYEWDGEGQVVHTATKGTRYGLGDQ